MGGASSKKRAASEASRSPPPPPAPPPLSEAQQVILNLNRQRDKFSSNMRGHNSDMEAMAARIKKIMAGTLPGGREEALRWAELRAKKRNLRAQMQGQLAHVDKMVRALGAPPVAAPIPPPHTLHPPLPSAPPPLHSSPPSTPPRPTPRCTRTSRKAPRC